MADLNITISIIILKVNSLRTPNKRLRLPDWIKKQDTTISRLEETCIKYKETNRLNVKECKKRQVANINPKTDAMAILTPCKVDFIKRNITRDKESH